MVYVQTCIPQGELDEIRLSVYVCSRCEQTWDTDQDPLCPNGCRD